MRPGEGFVECFSWLSLFARSESRQITVISRGSVKEASTLRGSNADAPTTATGGASVSGVMAGKARVEQDEPVRLTSADASAVFERLTENGAIARGGVSIIGLDSVRERLDDRWARKQEVVWDQLEAAAQRHLAESDLYVRLSETDYAIAVSEAEPVAAQAMALRILGEVLEHFLGDCRTEDLVIRQVVAANGAEIACAPLDPAEIQRRARGGGGSDAKVTKRRFHEQPFILSSMGGRDMRLKHDFEAVLSLGSRRTIATSLEPSVVDVASGRRIPGYAFRRLSDPDLWAIDRATLEFAEIATEQRIAPAPFVLPLSYQTLQSSRGRSRLVELVSGVLKPKIVTAIRNLDPGTPPSGLADLVGMLRRMDVTVFVRVEPMRDALAALADSRPNGVVLDVEPLAGQPGRIPDVLASFADRARRFASVLAVRGLTSPDQMAVAAGCGFTHASVEQNGALTLAA
jgi:hypothetical protein